MQVVAVLLVTVLLLPSTDVLACGKGAGSKPFPSPAEEHKEERDEIWELGIGLRGQTDGIVDKPECSSYQLLNESRRASHIGVIPLSYDAYLAEGWYRFHGAAGTKMQNTCVPTDHGCGTFMFGWLAGEHPTVAQGVVRRKVCFHFASDCCFVHFYTRVRDCGSFYVYKLKRSPYFTQYCGDGKQGKPIDDDSSGMGDGNSGEGSSPV